MALQFYAILKQMIQSRYNQQAAIASSKKKTAVQRIINKVHK